MGESKYSRKTFLRNSVYLGVFPLFTASPWRMLGSSDNDKKIFFDTGKADLNRLKEKLAAKTPMVWVFTGDSITQGVKHTHGARSYPEIFQERIRWELKRPRDFFVNTALSGNTAKNIVKDYDWRVSQFRPAVVSLMIGTNDCAVEGETVDSFVLTVKELISRIRKGGAIPILHTPNPILLKYAQKWNAIGSYAEGIRKVASEEDLILVDHYQHWQARLPPINKNSQFDDWLNDPTHPNGEGHKAMAKLLCKQLSIFDAYAPSCGGKYYEGLH